MKARLNYHQRLIALFLAVTLAYATVTLVYSLAQIRGNTAREKVLAAERLLAVAAAGVDGLLARVRNSALALQTDRDIMRFASNTRPQAEAACMVDASTAMGRIRQTDQAYGIRLAKRGTTALIGDAASSDLRLYAAGGTGGRLSADELMEGSSAVRYLVFGDDEGPVTPSRPGPLVVVHRSHPYILDGLLMIFEISPDVLFAGVEGIEGFRMLVVCDDRLVAASAPPLAVGDRTRGVVTSRSRVSALEYRLEYDASTAGASSLATLAGPLGLFILLCLLGVWLSRLVSQRLYAPVRRLLSALEDDRGTADSFDAALSAAEEFKRVNRELRSLVEQSRPSLRDAFVRDVLLGTVAPDEIPLGIARHGAAILRGPTIVCVCGVEESPGGGPEGGERMYTVHQRLLSLFGVVMRQERDFLKLGKDGSSSYFLFEGSDPPALWKSLRRALEAMEREHGFRLYAAVSEPVASPERLPATAQAVRALSLNARLRRQYRLLGVGQTADRGSVSYSHDQEGQLINAVVELDIGRVRRLLRMIADDNGGSEEDLLDALRTTAARAWAAASMPGSPPECPAAAAGSPSLAPRLTAWFESIVGSLAALEGEDRQTRKGEFLRYVEEHATENIGLAEMAESLNMSIGYASSLFRELVGVNFKDFLRTHRIREAKRILEGGTVLVKDLARRVGYVNTQTFIRAFTREAGLPPGQYIRSVTHGSAEPRPAAPASAGK
jgi:AraC-like DNA-binding protein